MDPAGRHHELLGLFHQLAPDVHYLHHRAAPHHCGGLLWLPVPLSGKSALLHLAANGWL